MAHVANTLTAFDAGTSVAKHCHQCKRVIEPGPNWIITEDALRTRRVFCGATCLYWWVRFFVPDYARDREPAHG